MRRVLFILVLMLTFSFVSSHASENKIYMVKLTGDVINPVSSEYLLDAIKKAESEKAEGLIIQLDTPGGLLTTTREIVKEIMASTIPIIVYVSPEGSRAGSAGVFITLSANIAAMAPSTNIGAAHPVTLGDKKSFGDKLEEYTDKLKKDRRRDDAPEPMEEKILNDTKAWVTTIAEKRGRNVSWALKAVTKSSSITAKEALKKNVIDLIAKDVDDLMKKIDGKKVDTSTGEVVLDTKSVQVIEIQKNVRYRVLSILAMPNIAYILLMLGFYGLLFEFTHPGIGFPGIAGFMSLVVASYGLHLIDANYAGVALIALGIILFIMEVKIVSYGLLTLGGIVSVLLGSLMLFDSPYEFMRVSLPLVLGFTLATLVITIFLVTLVAKLHRKKAVTGKEGLIGSIAEVKKWNGDSGKVFVHGEIWNAKGETDLFKNDKVAVSDFEGLTLIVTKKLDNQS